MTKIEKKETENEKIRLSTLSAAAG